jgi:hypothetical protein
MVKCSTSKEARKAREGESGAPVFRRVKVYFDWLSHAVRTVLSEYQCG